MASLKSSAPVEEQTPASKLPKTAFWSKFGMQPANKEKAQEKPALS
ncbi:MAG: hypothetical protein U0103_08465 [Candidatus Obscuribacterales bacterium]|nr:hypothetical protein [Cyanobacteria bacterium SZAS LIN-5]